MHEYVFIGEADGLNGEYITAIYMDARGDIWFGSFCGGSQKGCGVTLFDGKNFTWFGGAQGMLNSMVSGFTEDKNGAIWCYSYQAGLTRYGGRSFSSTSNREGLKYQDIRAVLRDSRGKLWLGSRWGGAGYFENGKYRWFPNENVDKQLVNEIVEDKKGNIWFATNVGAVMFDGRVFTHFDPSTGLKGGIAYDPSEGFDSEVWTIKEDAKGNIWLGTFGGGVYKYDGNRVEDARSGKNLGEDLSDLIRIKGNYVKTFTKYTTKQGLAEDNIMSLYLDKSHHVWFGGPSSTMKFDGKKINWFNDRDEYSNLFGASAFLEDDQNNYWIATGGGLLCKHGKYFIRFTEREGLLNNGVLDLKINQQGDLIVLTTIGLSIVRKEKFQALSKIGDDGKYPREVQQFLDEWSAEETIFKNYSKENGFPSRYLIAGKGMYEEKDGSMLIGSPYGLVNFKIGGEALDSVQPIVDITDVLLFNEKIDWSHLLSVNDSINFKGRATDSAFILGNGVVVAEYKFSGISKDYPLPEELNLAYNNNFVSFSFIGISLKHSKDVKYRYRLDGLDKNWSAISKNSTANYGNLPSGSYTFRVKAMNSDGIWSQESTFQFVVRPPWWETWWFRTLVLLSIIGSIVYYIRWREKSLIESKRILEKTVDERTAEVVAGKKLSDELLLNILPEEIAEELKAKGAAESQLIKQVTVLFTDFKGFTQLAEKLGPKELVAEIHYCFSAFDHIMVKYGIEKIKTIGDAYMAAGGLPTPNETHAMDVVLAAQEIQHFMLTHKAECDAIGTFSPEIRIGIHTGPVVAGIVGVKKFAYDIWGDTVNTASRMESSGEAGNVNISQATYELVKNESVFEFEPRGKIMAKGKGEMEMYFVHRVSSTKSS